MQQVQQRPRGTVAEVIYPPEHPVHREMSPLTPPVLQNGPGTPLGRAVSKLPVVRSLSEQQESNIQEQINALKSRGLNMRLQALIKRMKSAPLTPESHQAIEDWTTLFGDLERDDVEGRTLALGSLIFRVIRPSRERGLNKQEADTWESSCKAILRQMLPERETIDLFLQQCEHDLQEEQSFQNRLEMFMLAAQAARERVNSAIHEIEGEREQSLSSISLPLEALRISRERTQHVVEGVRREVFQVEDRALQCAAANAELQTQDTIQQERADAIRHEGEDLLRRL